MDWIGALGEQHPGLRILRDVPLKELTTFRIGGPVSGLLRPRGEEDILAAVDFCQREGIPYLILGNGSNLLASDAGFQGLAIGIGGPALGPITIQGETLMAGAGNSLTAVAKEALAKGLMGLEWAYGIPGTLGGAIAMNAGAYGGEMKQALVSVRALCHGTIVSLPASAGEMGYRSSQFIAPQCIVLSATLALQPDDGFALERQRDFMRRRRNKQPLEYPSAGSVFKRPKGQFAGALIEAAGLKGTRIGGAMVSWLHAGFIINCGGATASDVRALIEHIQQTVEHRFSVKLECEIKCIGEE